MKKILILFFLLVSIKCFGQTDTLIHININKNFNYTCADCPDSVLVTVDSLYVTVYDTISTGGGSSGQYEIIKTSSETYNVGNPAMYIYQGVNPSIFTLPDGTDPISGIDYLFVNSGTSTVLLEDDSGTDLIILDVGMVFNLIWDKINWIIY